MKKKNLCIALMGAFLVFVVIPLAIIGYLRSAGNQLWCQDSPGVAVGAEPSDLFGRVLVWGDFNGDNYDDLAIGIPYEDVGSVINAGAVQILYGSAGGISATGRQIWVQGGAGIQGGYESYDYFGATLAVGDFNGDNYDDLAIGAPHEAFGGKTDAGVVHILYGSAGGISATGNQLWVQDSPGINGSSESGDVFGYALATGDFNTDWYDDLAIGAPGESFGGKTDTGAVNILYGSAGGISATGNQLWVQDSPGVIGSSEPLDYFGYTLAAGDFDGNFYDDLVIGVPYEDIGTKSDAGVVNILYGSVGGISATGNQMWFQGFAGIIGASEASDFFGRALAVGNFDADLRDDLAIGVPGEDIGALVDAGAVNVLYGATGGISSADNQILYQDITGILGSSEASDNFGYALAVGDFDGDLCDDLAIGVPYEDVGLLVSAGAVNILYGWWGAPPSLPAYGNQLWTQDAGLIGGSEGFDYFGYALAAGDSNGDGYADLAIGAPGESFGGKTDAGVVHILFGYDTP